MFIIMALIIATKIILFAAKANADLMKISAIEDERDRTELKKVSARVSMQ